MHTSLPIPPLTFEMAVDFNSGADAMDLRQLPAAPGLYVIEDENGATIALATTANIRRMVASKFEPIELGEKRTRRIDYRAVARRVLAARVGSLFEAEWAYLQHARLRLPHTYRGLLDRWQAWFVACDPTAAFPQFVKTAHPTQAVNSDTTVLLGPFGDKHAAAHYMDLLTDAFDLCRYHHILVQAPKATACAYKEMGRCPAPCDGSISLDAYRASIAQAIGFAGTPIEQWREQMQQQMHAASARLDFEAAERMRLILHRTEPATRGEFRHVNRLERFAFAAVMPGYTRSTARIFLIRGGWIELVCEANLLKTRQGERSTADECNEIASRLIANAETQPIDFSPTGIENIGLVCRHLFHPKLNTVGGSFLRLHDNDLAARIAKALARLNRAERNDESTPAIAEQDFENIATMPDLQ